MEKPEKLSLIFFTIFFILIVLGALLLSVAFEIDKGGTVITLDKEALDTKYLRDANELE